MSTYGAVCFDLDNTLCASTQDRAALLETAFDRAGCDPFCTVSDLRAIVPTLPTAETEREFHESLFEAAARRTTGDPSVAPALAEAFLDAFDPSAVRFRPGAETALEAARESAPVALVTNGGRDTQTRKLESLGIPDTFDVAVFTDPANGVPPKPDATPFERALSGLAVDPSDAIHVGDSLHADVAGANAVGMDSAWVDTGRGHAGADRGAGTHEPTYELGSVDALATIV